MPADQGIQEPGSLISLCSAADCRAYTRDPHTHSLSHAHARVARRRRQQGIDQLQHSCDIALRLTASSGSGLKPLFLSLSCRSFAAHFLLTLSPSTHLSCSGGTAPSLDATSKEPIFAVIDEDVFIDCKVESIANYTLLWRFIKPSARDDDEGEILTAGLLPVSSDTRFQVLHEDGKCDHTAA